MRRETFCLPLHHHCSLNIFVRYFHWLFSSTFLPNSKDSQGQWTQGKDIETAVRRKPWPVSHAGHRSSASGKLSSAATLCFILQISILTEKNPFYRHWFSFVAQYSVNGGKLQKIVRCSVHGSRKTRFAPRISFKFLALLKDFTC